jgi:hypothetical protein
MLVERGEEMVLLGQDRGFTEAWEQYLFAGQSEQASGPEMFLKLPAPHAVQSNVLFWGAWPARQMQSAILQELGGDWVWTGHGMK